MGDLVVFPFGLMALAGVLGTAFGIWLRGLRVPAERRTAAHDEWVNQQLKELRSANHRNLKEVRRLSDRVTRLDRQNRGAS